MKKYIILFFITLFTTVYASDFTFYTAVKNDTVFIYTNHTLEADEQLIVEMKNKNDTDFELITTMPIVADLDPFNLQKKLGRYYSMLLDITKAQNEQELLLTLRTDNFIGTTFSLLDSNTANLLGRFVYCSGLESNKTYTFRLTLEEKTGKKLATVERDILVKETSPKTSPKIFAEQKNESVEITWDYPDWYGDERDLVIQFYIERKMNNENYERITEKIFPRVGKDFYHYTDSQVTAGGAYTYRIRAVDAIGLTGPFSKEFSISVLDKIPPVQPTGLTSEIKKKTVHLKWTPNIEQDLSHYDIYRTEVEKADSIKINSKPIAPNNPFYVDSTIVYKHTYYYHVVAIDSAGNWSKPSEAAHALATDTTPPPTPTNLTTTVKDRTVTLSWNSVFDTDLKGYKISRSLNDAAFFPLNDEILADTFYVDKSEKGAQLVPGGHYYYAVKAVDALANTSDVTGMWVIIPDDQPPSPTGQVNVKNIQGRFMQISWNPSPSDDVANYQVERLTDSTRFSLGTFSNKTHTVRDDGLTLGSTVHYAVTAIDTAGNKSAEKRSYDIKFQDFTEPPAPRFVEIAKIDDQLKIQWDPVGAADCAGYNIYQAKLPTGIGKKINTNPIQINFFIITNGDQNSWYWIKTVDISGNESEKSKAVKTI